MKLVVVSDNHGNTYFMEEIYSIHQEDTDEWIHCGDSELLETHPLWQTYKTVRGNMDITSKFKPLRVERLGDLCYLLVHGHQHNIKSTYQTLGDLAEKEDAKIVFYGHTHKPKVEKAEGIIFVNPGSITQPRDRNKGTYLVLTVNDQLSNMTFTFYDQDHNIQEDLSTQISLNKE
ncbi:metallophosphoesterase family protein [Alkalibacterium kapii]|uniref:Phosphoesterase n=1 Tax=Alkalibacterium kapii TaxID=426704 RepID=A0A511AVD0_9LACT|nr:metallophosphoesterase [Alkalibacterium kapii]GEK92158.1 putative metallophosphoesterase YsnB [Alkalibacterium kapii]